MKIAMDSINIFCFGKTKTDYLEQLLLRSAVERQLEIVGEALSQIKKIDTAIYNLGEKPTHFYQIWIYPDKPGLKPSYEQKQFSPEMWKNKLCPLASGQGKPNTVIFHTNATIYRASLEAGKTLDFHASKSRSIFIYLIYGELAMNDTILKTSDQLRIECAEPLSFEARNNSELILVDVPFSKD
ncbi:MAG: hypothetical protein HUU50_20395 [Candidatus Brocadiae bacterium]|nr:hypothetical protein [Candidatus Brocadiia bacterium]